MATWCGLVSSADRLFEPEHGPTSPRRSRGTIDAVAAEPRAEPYPDQIIAASRDTPTTRQSSATQFSSPNQYTVNQAMAVFDYLSGRSRLKPNQLFLVGHGANHPVVSNATAAGQARNRRVENGGLS